MIPVPITTSSTFPTDEISEINFIIQQSKIKFVFTSSTTYDTLKKTYSSVKQTLPSGITWHKIPEFTAKNVGNSAAQAYKKFDVEKLNIAYVEYSKNSVGELTGTLVSHALIMKQCQAFIETQGLTYDDVLLNCLEPRQLSGFLFGVYVPIILGIQSVFLQPAIYKNGDKFLTYCSKYRGTLIHTYNLPHTNSI
jgi:acyl-CoA synthetase (AMP-forming)/AMP-acid ligase II